MSRNRPDSAKILQNEIRRQFGSAGTSRFLRALPGFKAEAGIPKRFVNLLTKLDHAESDQRNAGYTPGRTAGG